MDIRPAPSKLNLPNLLTLLRIVSVPALIIFLIQGRFREAVILFTIAGISDALDGLLARWLRQKTSIGAILDPIADKLLLDSTYVVLSVMGPLPDWLAVVVISRDVIIVSGVLLLHLTQGVIRIRPTIASKLTTLLQLGTAYTLLLYLDLGWFSGLLPFQFYATGALTVLSGGQYLLIGFRLLNSAGHR